MARDIGLFGVRKRDIERETAAAQEPKEIAKEEGGGEKKQIAAGSAPDSSSSAADSDSDSSNLGAVLRPSPVAQAAAVVGAEIAATLIASSLVSGILNNEA
jgi:hypothetical protein